MFLFKKKKGRKRVKLKKVTRRRKASRDSRLRGIKLRKTIISVLFALLILASGVAYYMGVFTKFKNWAGAETLRITSDAGFRVSEILLTGRYEIKTDDILSRLSVKKDMPIFAVDIDTAQQSIADIPWIKDVSISRRLPNIVFVDIKERKPVALWQEHKKLSLIDIEGKILTTQNLEKWKELPLVVGHGSKQNIEDLVVMLKAEPVIASEVSSASRVGKRRWDLHLKSGLLIKLPEKDKEFALRRLAVLQQEKNILAKDISIIDLRSPEKMIVKLAKPTRNVPLNSKNGKDAG